jgi:hypothetical protein
MRTLACVLLWLALTAEVEGSVYHGLWSTPLTTLGTLIFKTTFSIVPWDLLVLLTTLLSQRGWRKNCVLGLLRSLAITCGGVVALWLWGVLRGGSAYQTYFQLHHFVMGLLVALMVIVVFRTPRQIELLGKVVLAAALYRGCSLLVFFFAVAQHLEEPLPYLTDHGDSLLFVAGLFLPIANLMEQRNGRALRWALLAALVLVPAMALNNRRIVWLGLAVGLLLSYILLPAGKTRKRVNRALLLLSPALLAYVIAGWGNPVGIFKPVGSISTMFGEHQDTSSMMRDIENHNLIVTLRSNPLLGTGWGWEYIEQVRAVNIAHIFPQYRYLPHNSLLGLMGFTGLLGFTAIWQVIAVAVFLHARVQLSQGPKSVRVAAVASLVALSMVVLMIWGDVGFMHRLVNVCLGIALGLAARLPRLMEQEHAVGLGRPT